MAKLTRSPKFAPLPDRFWPKVDKRGPDDCWEWTRARDQKGYGLLKALPETRAHRISWIINHGPIPPGKLVLHRCDNPPCVNPNHLFLGTNADNMADMVRKDRQSRKLSDDDIVEIRALAASGLSQRAIADRFNITQAQVGHISSLITTGRHVPLDNYVPTKISSAKLNSDNVRAIRTLVRSGVPQKALASQFGVSRATISLAVNRITWR